MAVVAGLAVPAIAFAATSHHYSGPIDNGGRVGFGTIKKDGDLYVRAFGWSHLKIQCDQGPFKSTNGITGKVKVRDGDFHIRGVDQSGPSHVRVTGHFSHHLRRAHGTLRLEGNLDQQHTNCDSGRRTWHADRTS